MKNAAFGPHSFSGDTMKAGLKIGDFELTWLNGGTFELDGGAMFGVVPKVLWQKKYPPAEDNYIPLAAWPILVKTPQALVLIESGIGNKLTDKQKKIYRIKEDWSVLEDLKQFGVTREDIDFVVLTHYDFDHAGGVVMQEADGTLGFTFPKATHILQKKEWHDVLNPNIRTINTYWPLNNELMRTSSNLHLIDGRYEVVPGISVVHTGGHNGGHQIVTIESRGGKVLHLGDLLPTHAHANPLWVMAYDNFPMDTIAAKEQWMKQGVAEGVWFTFYHDHFMTACKYDDRGNVTDKWPAL
jgi:glyoxylase-like metal-dependent hydrolase (beta-lactamase superfamily II)